MNHVLLFCGTGCVCSFRRFEELMKNTWSLGFCDETKPAVATDGQPAIVGCASGCIFIMCGDGTNRKASHTVALLVSKTSGFFEALTNGRWLVHGQRRRLRKSARVMWAARQQQFRLLDTMPHTTTALVFHQLSLSTFLRMAEHALPLSVSRDISFQLVPLVDADAYSGTRGIEALICTTTSLAVHANHIQRAILFLVSNQPGFFHGEVPSRVLLRCAHRGRFSFLVAAHVCFAGSTDVAVCFHW